MSKLQVTVEKVSDVKPHPNADRLELATVLGWQCVVGKGNLKPGDLVVYFPIDSVLPDGLIERLFSDSKIKPKEGRIRTIKIRGAISQGLAIPITHLSELPDWKVGDDVTSLLGVTKYEPPQTLSPQSNVRQVSARESNPNFYRYTDIDHLKKFPTALEGKRVIVTEKIHGTNFRAGWVPRANLKWWQKLLVMAGITDDQEFVYGSHNVQLQNRTEHDLYSSRDKMNVYLEAVEILELKKTMPRNTVVYGEIYGDGIQTGYSYGCEKGVRGLVLFDAKVNGKFLDWVDLEKLAFLVDVELAPILYVGDFSMEEMEYHVEGPSSDGTQPIREGIVVRTVHEETGYNGRQIYKLLNPEYLLLKDNSDFH
jgi:RNA ligase (TIGR02306 family)